MDIKPADVITLLESLNLTVTAMNDQGRTAIYADGSTGKIAGVILEQSGTSHHIPERTQILETDGYDETVRDFHCPDAQAVTARVMETIGITGALPHRRVISVDEATAKLTAMGFMVVTEHTGGGTFTTYLNRNGGAPFALGPITTRVATSMFLSTHELAFGLDQYWTEDEDPKTFWFGQGEDIDSVFNLLEDEYAKMEASGNYPRESGGEFAVPRHTGEKLAEMMPPSLLGLQ